MIKNPLSDFQQSPEKIYGIWRGCVEDNKDPKRLGRCRIRVLGLHTEVLEEEKKHGVPVKNLIWAEPVMPISEGAVSGYGIWSVPLQGSWVYVFFENGELMSPRYFGSSPGIPIEGPLEGIGFNDPDLQYPEEGKLNLPDSPREFYDYYIEENIDDLDLLEDMEFFEPPEIPGGGPENSYISVINESLIIVEDAECGILWEEPNAYWATEYPHNFMISVHGGLSIELDSTPDNRRLTIYHPSNSRIEINESGDMVMKNTGTRYDIFGAYNGYASEGFTLRSDIEIKLSAPIISLCGEVIGGGVGFSEDTTEIENKNVDINGDVVTITANEIHLNGTVFINGSEYIP